MRIKKAEGKPGVGFNMTPMIDVVFQLIIFFMLVTDLANTQLEALHLSKATEAQEDKQPPKDRLVINLVHQPLSDHKCKELKYNMNGDLITPCQNEAHWKIKINNREIRMPELVQVLIIEGNLNRELLTKAGKLGFSKRVVMIRGDAGVPYRIVEKVLSACCRARLHRLEIGAKKPPEGEKID